MPHDVFYFCAVTGYRYIVKQGEPVFDTVNIDRQPKLFLAATDTASLNRQCKNLFLTKICPCQGLDIYHSLTAKADRFTRLC